MNCLYQTKRISKLKEKMLSSKRYASIEQARIITRVYQENEKLSIAKKRALSLKAALEELEISVEDEELIVGNRTKGVRYGVVFPESGCSWINQEFEMLPTRPQDQFLVKEEDIKEVKEEAGLDVSADKIIAVQDRTKHNLPVYAYGVCKVFVLCSVLGGQFQENIETTEFKYFNEDEIPKLAEEKNTIEQVKMCFKAYKSESWETIFD